MKTRPKLDEAATPLVARPRRRPVKVGRPGAARNAGLPADWTGHLDVADPGTIVGRQPELAHLRSAWQDTVADADDPDGERPAHLILLAGEPGVGKTRLAAELAALADADEGRVLVGHCSRDAAEPYGPFVEALAPTLRTVSPAWLTAHASEYGQTLARVFGTATATADGANGHKSANGNTHDDGADSLRPRSRVLAGIVAAVNDLGTAPVLLVLEDLHWATPSTVHVIEQLLRSTGTVPVLVVGTYRDTAIHPSHPLAALLDGQPLERIFLPDLSPQDVTALLVDRAAVAGAAAAELSHALWTATEGNPFLLTEVVRDLLQAGALRNGAVKAKAAEVGLAHDAAELLARRLGKPGSPRRDAIEVASVVGSTFTVELVSALAGQKEDDTRAALAQAVASAVVVKVADRPDTFRFAHELLHEAADGLLSSSRRVSLHHDLAVLLEKPDRLPPAPAPAVLLQHRAAAAPVGRSDEGSRHAEAAGRAAMNVLAFEEAANLFGRALALLRSPDSARRVDLLMALAESHRESGEAARARQSWLQAADMARADHDSHRLAQAVLGLGTEADVWGADTQLIGLLDQAIAEVDSPADAGLRARLIARLAQARAALDTPDERKARSDQAWELAWDSKDAETMGSVLLARHEALSAPDDLDDRIEMDGELYAMASSAKDDELALLAHGWRLVDLLEKGNVGEADWDRTHHARLAGRSADPRHQRDAARWAAAWALLQGKPANAISAIDEALALGQQARDAEASSAYWTQQLDLHLDWGSPDELDEMIGTWGEVVRSNESGAFWRSSLALLLVRAGRHDEAAVELDDLLAQDGADIPLDRHWVATVAAIGEVAAALDDARCGAVAELLRPYAPRLVVTGHGLTCRGAVTRVLGMLFSSAGAWTPTERNFQAALSTHERIGAPALLARTRADFGRALARKQGGKLHAGRVKATLEQAVDEAEEAGLRTLAAETQALLDDLG